MLTHALQRDNRTPCLFRFVRRKTDDIELAKAAAEAGMGAFVLKAHQGSIVRKKERAYR